MSAAFWAEFFKVQIDKFLLVGLFVFLYLHHADEKILFGVLGVLGASFGQGRRFKY